jgi:hypothetical protein
MHEWNLGEMGSIKFKAIGDALCPMIIREGDTANFNCAGNRQVAAGQ